MPALSITQSISPDSPTAGDPLTLTVTLTDDGTGLPTSTGPDGEPIVPEGIHLFTMLVDWGDGSTGDQYGNEIEPAWSTAATFSHTYATAGTYDIAIQATADIAYTDGGVYAGTPYEDDAVGGVGVGIGEGSGSSSNSGSNHPPVLDPVGETPITPGQPFSLQVSATDPDGDPITYSASLPAGLGIDPGTGFVSGTLPDDGTYQDGDTIPVSFTADDGRGGTDSISTDLLVQDPTSPPPPPPPPLPVISLTAVNVQEGSSGEVIFTRTGGDLSQELTVAYEVSGTATPGNPGDPGADYQTLSGAVTFDPGSATADVTLAAFTDEVYDPDETVALTIYPTDQYTLADDAITATVVNVIVDQNETSPPPPPQVVVTVAGTGDATEGGADGAFEFTRSGDLSQPLTVSYTVAGDATPGVDYDALPGTITFAAGSATAVLPVHALDDATPEPDEAIDVSVLADPANPGGVYETAEVLVIENDGRLGGKAWWDANANGAEESGEVGLGGVPVDLYDTANNLLDSTVTAADGTYVFMCPSTVSQFILHFGTPNGYTLTSANVNSGGFTDPISLAPGDDNEAFDVGLNGQGPVVKQTQQYLLAEHWAYTDMDLTANGIDPAGDPISPVIVSQPTHGTLSLNSSTGLYDYAGDTSYTGLDSFQYKLTDGTHDSDVVTLTILDYDGITSPDAYQNFPGFGAGALYIGNNDPVTGQPRPDTFQIKQGGLNDCWFVAAAAGETAQWPTGITSKMVDNGDGSYGVSYKLATMRVSFVDAAERAKYSTANGDWLKVLEKGYSLGLWDELSPEQRAGKTPYDYLNRNNPSDTAIPFITGDGVKRFDFGVTSDQTIRDALSNALNRSPGKVVTALCDDTGDPVKDQALFALNGIKRDHVYTVVAYDPVGKRVKLRNPHGMNKAFTTAAGVTTYLGKGLTDPGYPTGNTGYFWLSMTTFEAQFADISVEQ